MFSLFTAPIARRLSARAACPALLCFALLLPAPAFALDPPLTLAEAQRLAVQHSRQLPAQDAAITAAREMAVAAAQLPDPVLKAGIDNLPASGQDRFSTGSDFMTMRRVGIAQELTRSAKRQLRSERFEREADKSRAARTAARAAIERDAALAWLERHYAEGMAALAAEQQAQASIELDAADGAYRAGRGGQADLLAARSALSLAMDRSSELQRRVASTRTMLARWTGGDADAPLADRPAMDALALDPARLDAQLAHHPDVAVLNRQEDIAVSEARLAEANKTADWSVELAFQQRGSAYSKMVSVGVSVPLQWDRKNRQDREHAARLALVEQAKAERDEVLREHLADTRKLIGEWENGRERFARFERERIPLAGERIQATLAAYRGGKASLADVLAARRGEIEIRLQALQLQLETARLWARLNFLLPTTTPFHRSAP